MSTETCCACSGEPVARVLDGAFRKPVCASHRRLYSERGYLIDALPTYRLTTPTPAAPSRRAEVNGEGDE